MPTHLHVIFIPYTLQPSATLMYESWALFWCVKPATKQMREASLFIVKYMFDWCVMQSCTPLPPLSSHTHTHEHARTRIHRNTHRVPQFHTSHTYTRIHTFTLRLGPCIAAAVCPKREPHLQRRRPVHLCRVAAAREVRLAHSRLGRKNLVTHFFHLPDWYISVWKRHCDNAFTLLGLH